MRDQGGKVRPRSAPTNAAKFGKPGYRPTLPDPTAHGYWKPTPRVGATPMPQFQPMRPEDNPHQRVLAPNIRPKYDNGMNQVANPAAVAGASGHLGQVLQNPQALDVFRKFVGMWQAAQAAKAGVTYKRPPSFR